MNWCLGLFDTTFYSSGDKESRSQMKTPVELPPQPKTLGTRQIFFFLYYRAVYVNFVMRCGYGNLVVLLIGEYVEYTKMLLEM